MGSIKTGYSQIPNFIFNLELSPHAKLVLINLIRRADRKKSGICFPSLKTIGQDCSIRSENTIRKAIRELEEWDLVNTQHRGRKLFFFISPRVYGAIDKANTKYIHNSELEDDSASGEGISDGGEKRVVKTDLSPSRNACEYPHEMSANVNPYNEETKKENTPKEKVTEPNGSLHPSKKDSNCFYYSLSDEEQRIYDEEAKKAWGSNDVPGLAHLRDLRFKLYEGIIAKRNKFTREVNERHFNN